MNNPAIHLISAVLFLFATSVSILAQATESIAEKNSPQEKIIIEVGDGAPKLDVETGKWVHGTPPASIVPAGEKLTLIVFDSVW